MRRKPAATRSKRIVAETEAELTGRKAELDIDARGPQERESESRKRRSARSLPSEPLKNVVESFKDGDDRKRKNSSRSTVVRANSGARSIPAPAGTAPQQTTATST